jgi:hypothetical protein
VAIAAAFAFQQYELLPGIWGSIGAGAVGGAINGGARGALIGAFAGGMFSGIHGIDFSENIISDTFQRSMAHGFVGSGMSVLSGGDIGTGFLSTFVPGALGAQIGGIGGDDFAGVFSRVVMAGAIGGVSAKVAGGDFWDGFQTGAFARLFNHEAGKLFRTHAEAAANAEDKFYGRGDEQYPDNPKDLDRIANITSAGSAILAATPVGQILLGLTVGLHMIAGFDGLVLDGLGMYTKIIGKYIGLGPVTAERVGYVISTGTEIVGQKRD